MFRHFISLRGVVFSAVTGTAFVIGVWENNLWVIWGALFVFGVGVAIALKLFQFEKLPLGTHPAGHEAGLGGWSGGETTMASDMSASDFGGGGGAGD